MVATLAINVRFVMEQPRTRVMFTPFAHKHFRAMGQPRLTRRYIMFNIYQFARDALFYLRVNDAHRRPRLPRRWRPTTRKLTQFRRRLFVLVATVREYRGLRSAVLLPNSLTRARSVAECCERLCREGRRGSTFSERFVALASGGTPPQPHLVAFLYSAIPRQSG